MSSVNSLKIDDGKIRLAINDDPKRVIAFNPNDMGFIEKIYRLVSDYQGMEAKYERVVAENGGLVKRDVLRRQLEEEGRADVIDEALKIATELFSKIDQSLDDLFGEGAAQKITDGARSFHIYEQFFDGIAPFIQISRAEVLEKYNHPAYTRKKHTKKK